MSDLVWMVINPNETGVMAVHSVWRSVKGAELEIQRLRGLGVTGELQIAGAFDVRGDR